MSPEDRVGQRTRASATTATSKDWHTRIKIMLTAAVIAGAFAACSSSSSSGHVAVSAGCSEAMHALRHDETNPPSTDPHSADAITGTLQDATVERCQSVEEWVAAEKQIPGLIADNEGGLKALAAFCSNTSPEAENSATCLQLHREHPDVTPD